jgi:hypothetical protein
LAVADYAERVPDAQPPPELTFALRCQRYPGALPFEGALGSQPAGLLDRMEYYLWVFQSVSGFNRAKSWQTWSEANPHGWKLINWIKKARKLRAEMSSAPIE